MKHFPLARPHPKMDTPTGLFSGACVCGWVSDGIETRKGAMASATQHSDALGEPYPKFRSIPRLFREVVVTEKIDGTNGLIRIIKKQFGESAVWDSSSFPPGINVVFGPDGEDGLPDEEFWVIAGSRKRWVSPEDDNAGFARWVSENAAELVGLGEGDHYGEWWGSGIQRGYGLARGEKRFSLFNTGRWSGDTVPDAPGLGVVPIITQSDRPICQSVNDSLALLREYGSFAAPGFMRPEGVVAYHTAAGSYFKATIEGDETGKGYGA